MGSTPADHQRHTTDVIGVGVDDVDLAEATEAVIGAARQRQPLGVSALAVHGVVTAHDDEVVRRRVNELELVVADGQPVRWAMQWLEPVSHRDKVSGPELVDAVCARADAEGLAVYLFGSTSATLEAVAAALRARHPQLVVAGSQPSRFRAATASEAAADVAAIRASGASLVLVGLGCPRQETWVFENRAELAMPLLAVGAAFDYHAGNITRAPRWAQRAGLEWAHRLRMEPRRLWRRYAATNPRFLWLVARQRLGKRFGRRSPPATADVDVPPARPG